MEAKRLEIHAAEVERTAVQESIAAAERATREEEAARLEKQRAFGVDMRAQIVYNQGLRDAERVERDRELERFKDAERDYQERMQRAIDKHLSQQAHPFRRALQKQTAPSMPSPGMPYVPGYLRPHSSAQPLHKQDALPAL